jgi:hypothetical protein
MGWVVKRWRSEALERLLCDDAREAVRAARQAADRDARRARRAADRTAAEAARELEALERLGEELRATLRRRRAAVRAAPPGDVVAVRSRRRRPERASLRASALTELFRATGAA